MCGVPYHAVDVYLNRLVSKGYKVAIGEQVEEPKLAKGLVKREVIKVVTPGTNINAQTLDEGKHNYLMCIVYMGDEFGLAVCDVATGDFLVTELDSLRALNDEITKFAPSEIICNTGFMVSGADADDIKNRLGISIFTLDSWYFDDETAKKALMEHFKVMSLEGLGLADYNIGSVCAGALMLYLRETQKNSLEQLSSVTTYTTGKYMIIDTSTRRNLELVETLREKQKKGSLLWVLDKTRTAMGARTLRGYIEQPLVDPEKIEERLIGRIAYNSATPRDMTAFKTSIQMIPHIKRLLGEFKAESSNFFREINDDMDDLSDIADMIDKAIMEEPPLSIKDGGIIKDGYNDEVDRLRLSKTEGKNWLAELEAFEREQTHIKTSLRCLRITQESRHLQMRKGI